MTAVFSPGSGALDNAPVESLVLPLLLLDPMSAGLMSFCLLAPGLVGGGVVVVAETGGPTETLGVAGDGTGTGVGAEAACEVLGESGPELCGELVAESGTADADVFESAADAGAGVVILDGAG